MTWGLQNAVSADGQWGTAASEISEDLTADFRRVFLSTECGRRVLSVLGMMAGCCTDEVFDGPEGRDHYVRMQFYKQILMICEMFGPEAAERSIRALATKEAT